MNFISILVGLFDWRSAKTQILLVSWNWYGFALVVKQNEKKPATDPTLVFSVSVKLLDLSDYHSVKCSCLYTPS